MSKSKIICPHIGKLNLIDIEKFQKIPFENLKCQNCEEKNDLCICLICGETFCSKIINSHFIQHNKDNEDHCIYIGLNDLNILCKKCINDTQNNEDNSNNKGSYIDSNIGDKYVKIINEYKLGKNVQKTENFKEKKNENEEQKENSEKLIDKKEICSHVKNENIISQFKYYLETYFNNHFYLGDKLNLYIICLICSNSIDNLEALNNHYNSQKHKLYINLLDFTIICMECMSKYNLSLVNDLIKFKIIFQILHEKQINLPKEANLLTSEEIFDIKYKKLITSFKNNRFSKILFMVGAGISTSAGIPDFRSNTGLFKQLQNKYNLSSPEEFFLKSTFLKNPIYFYEFTKIFDLSKVKSTISHKFINFFVNKNIVKYIFTQNIDGLEIKAKIPEEKLVFAHGNFNNGHCANCDIPIDIKLINEGIEKGEIYYCPKCGGPCKPNIVFYGEDLPDRFYEKLEECKDIDLIIIMGTSLKVKPFANIPFLTNPYASKIVFNMEKVGLFKYEYLENDAVLLKGKTDEKVIQFLKDIELYNEFSNFIKKEYNEELDDIIGKENELINVNKSNENNKKIENLSNELEKININEKK